MSPLATALSPAGQAAVRGCRRRHRGQLRILPAQDREDGGRRSGSRSRRWSRSRRASSRSPTAPAARPASAPTPPSRGSSARPACTPAAHLTCVEASRDEIDEVARAYWEAGVRHIVALRGDPPEPGKPFAPHPGRLCQCRRAGRRPEAGRAVRDLGRRLSRMPSGFAEPRAPISTISSARSTPAPTGRSPSSSSRPTASSASATRPPRPASTPRSCRASCRSPTSPRPASSRRMCGATIPPWMDRLFEGLDDLPAARQLVAATVAAELCGQLYAGGVRHFHFYTLNRAELSYAICHLLGLRPEGRDAVNAAEQLRAEAAKRILVKDGAYGTADPGAPARARPIIAARSTSARDQKGNNDLLNLTRPELVARDRRRASPTPAPTSSPPTRFNANRISQADYGAEHLVREINRRRGADHPRGRRRASRPDGRRRFVAGALGPTNKTLSLSPNVNDPGYREVDFDTVSRRLCRADRGAGRRRRRLHPDRDGVRHAERQGRDPRRAPSRGARPRAADHAVDDDHRPVAAATSPAIRSRPSGPRSATPGRCRSGSTARSARPSCAPHIAALVGDRRHLDHGLSQCRPAQRSRRI